MLQMLRMRVWVLWVWVRVLCVGCVRRVGCVRVVWVVLIVLKRLEMRGGEGGRPSLGHSLCERRETAHTPVRPPVRPLFSFLFDPNDQRGEGVHPHQQSDPHHPS